LLISLFEILDTEIISGNGPEKYNIYIDKLGYKFIQHVLELPIILIPYVGNFISESKPKTKARRIWGNTKPAKAVELWR